MARSLDILVVLVKAAGGSLALGLVRPWGRSHRAAVAGPPRRGRGTPLVLYGSVYVLVGGVVLGVVITPSVDSLGPRWYVFVRDPWFLLWDLALGMATWRSHIERSSS